ncbi:Protease Do-like chloroplastic [Chlorella sorokiniana]|uniref:Protease Do-like chloroplastic n=1 Tax=Chlorella sorokiniana TaxID=3076 RepID=A0A2P6TLL5_CHLSO|nr:Protease Do-like chloroplastic [Chlorella sorokiniana]|eukprot:PRW45178.1 Protease Do-like chloroplastic [Chlorella sorokiniana]
MAEARVALTQEETRTIQLFQRSRPSVVYITSLTTRRDAFTLNMLEIPQGEGSGFVWDKNGHVVTNYHVIRGASDVLVTLAGGEGQPAKVVGYDEDKDVAVLQINLKEMEGPLQPLKLGSSSDLEVGQKVFAIGNPFGLDHTLTTGVISGTGREISSGNTGRPIQDVIQTDAAINPGNSGGPLLDSGGGAIGINTAIYSQSGTSSGVGFAIPIDVVKSSVEQIIQYGKVVRPIMGISFAPDQSVEQLGMNGVLVLNARDGGPAAKAGIRGSTRDEYGRLVLGDVIIAINGKRINSASDLYRVLDKSSVGDKLDVEVLRADATEHVKITLEASG